MCRVSSVKDAFLFQPLLSLSPSPGDDVHWQASVSSCGDPLSLSPCDVSVPFPLARAYNTFLLDCGIYSDTHTESSS